MITAPPNATVFRIPTSNAFSADWSKIETHAIELLQISEAYQKELARLLIANSFQTGGRLVCNFEAFFSVARLCFSLSIKTRAEDWPVVSRAVQANPRVIFDVLSLNCTSWYSQEQFFIFTVDGVSSHFAADLAELGTAVATLNKRVGELNPSQLILQP